MVISFLIATEKSQKILPKRFKRFPVLIGFCKRKESGWKCKKHFPMELKNPHNDKRRGQV